jgi:hypothetical protein
MELTFMTAFCRGGNLKAFWSTLDLPQVLQNIKNIIYQYFGADFHGTLLSDLEALGSFEPDQDRAFMDDNKKCSTLPQDIYANLATRLNLDSAPLKYCIDDVRMTEHFSVISSEVQNHHKFKSQGAVFITAHQSKNDSLILYHPGPDIPACAGQIQDIFVHSRGGPNGNTITEYFLVVQPYRQLNAQEAKLDPYRHYPLLDVQLYHDDLNNHTVVIKASNIVSHVATCPHRNGTASKRYRVVLLLNRVCAFAILEWKLRCLYCNISELTAVWPHKEIQSNWVICIYIVQAVQKEMYQEVF